MARFRLSFHVLGLQALVVMLASTFAALIMPLARPNPSSVLAIYRDVQLLPPTIRFLMCEVNQRPLRQTLISQSL